MEPFVFGIGVLVTLLFFTGIFYTVREFKQMDKAPEDYHKEKDHLKTSG